MTTEPILINVEKWIEENKKDFLPPVCNKMMHNKGQMKQFYVGGPNQRKDYHIEIGEELFYMRKGDMCLKVVEHNKHRDVIIKEGEIFLLPGRIAHSPQRFADTVGLVIERERAETELDGLRYYTEENGVATLQPLYEAWFHCVDLGTQLAPVIKAYFASEQHKTGKPIPGTIPDPPPVVLDSERHLQDPFSLKAWLNQHRAEMDLKGCKKMFEGNFQFQVFAYGAGTTSDQCATAETFIWQLEGSSLVTVEGHGEHRLNPEDTLLVPVGQKFTVTQSAGSAALVCYQDPTKV